jgi:O-antigen ligase
MELPICIKKHFSGLKPLELSEYLLLLAIAAAIPLSWNLAIKILALLVLNTIIKMICTRHIGNTTLGKADRVQLLLMISFFVIYVVSMLYTSNSTEGWDNIIKKLSFIILPVIFLLSDLRYLKHEHKKWAIGIFTIALIARFLYYLFRATICYIECGYFPLDMYFDPLHHTYLSLYVLFVLPLLYLELRNHASKMPRYKTAAIIVTILILVTYIILTQSRTGVLGIIFLAFAMLVDLIIIQKRFVLGIILIATISAGAIGVYLAQPETSHRLSNTISAILSGNREDARFIITRTALQTIGDNMPFGVGVGDRIDEMNIRYRKNTQDEEILQGQFNPHNQYLDTLLATGIPGLAILLTLLILPLCRKTNGKHYVVAFISSVAFCSLFESLMERQMGILFVCLFYCLLCGTSAPEKSQE